MHNNTITSLNNVFNATSLSPDSTDLVSVGEVLPPAPTPAEPDDEADRFRKEDFIFSRDAIKTIATETQATMQLAMDVAKQTDAPRAYEVAADMVRATLEAHRELHSIHKTFAELQLAARAAESQKYPGTVNIQQGVVFSGTSDELLRLISKDRQ